MSEQRSLPHNGVRRVEGRDLRPGQPAIDVVNRAIFIATLLPTRLEKGR